MTNKTEKHPIGPFTREIAQKVRGLTAEQGITQVQIAKHLGRRQSYVSVRMNAKAAWTTSDLEVIASMIEMSGMQLLQEIFRRAGP